MNESNERDQQVEEMLINEKMEVLIWDFRTLFYGKNSNVAKKKAIKAALICVNQILVRVNLENGREYEIWEKVKNKLEGLQ